VFCCPCCAAGDIAKAAGRDYCMSCCIIPHFVGCIAPCWWASDRQALTQRYNIDDKFSWCVACCMFTVGCPCCLPCCMMAQELNHIKVRGVYLVVAAVFTATRSWLCHPPLPQPPQPSAGAPRDHAQLGGARRADRDRVARARRHGRAAAPVSSTSLTTLLLVRCGVAV